MLGFELLIELAAQVAADFFLLGAEGFVFFLCFACGGLISSTAGSAHFLLGGVVFLTLGAFQPLGVPFIAGFEGGLVLFQLLALKPEDDRHAIKIGALRCDQTR